MDFRRIFDLLSYQAAKYPMKAALAQRSAMRWESYSTQECIELSEQISAGLLNLGIQAGDQVAIISAKRQVMHILLEIGIMQIGAVVVPLASDCTPQALQTLFGKGEIQYCFAANRESYQKLSEVKNKVKTFKKAFTFFRLPDTESLEDIMTTPIAVHLEEMQTLKAAIHEDDLAILKYRWSDDSNSLLGIPLTHKNIISTINGLRMRLNFAPNAKSLSFLPANHISECTLIYTYIASGVSIHFAPETENLLSYIQELKPNYLGGLTNTPELLIDQLFTPANQTRNWYRDQVAWSIHLGKQYKGRKKISFKHWLQLLWAELLVYRNWRRRLGGNMEGIIIGTAIIREEMCRLFAAANLRLFDGLGMDESSGFATLRAGEPHTSDFITIGEPIPGMEIRLDPDRTQISGEIQLKGDGVMLGYYQNEDATGLIFTEDAWLKTNKTGEFQNNQFLVMV